MRDWSSYRPSPVRFSKALKQEVRSLPLLAKVERDHPQKRVGLVHRGSDKTTLSLSLTALWWTMTRPGSLTAFQVSNRVAGVAWIGAVRTLAEKIVPDVSMRFQVASDGSFMSRIGEPPSIFYTVGNEIDTSAFRQLSGSPLLVIVPEIEQIPGPFLKSGISVSDLAVWVTSKTGQGVLPCLDDL